MHLTEESHLLPLSETVRQTLFEDAQNTFTDPCLVGPPTVEFAPYGRIPGGRRRTDARAGTIDQDPDFMAFLEALANPVTTKENNTDLLADGAAAKPEKVTTTPLVQYLKDKKASKSKDAAAKAAKRQELQLAKSKSGKESSNSEDSKKKGKEAKAVKGGERTAKEAVKILSRQANEKSATVESGNASGLQGEGTTNPKLDISKVPGRQRGAVIAAHIRMLQRDLGLSPAQAHRQVRRDTADAQKAERAAAAEKALADSKDADTSQSPQLPLIPAAPKGSSTHTGGKKSRGKQTDNETNKSTPSSTPTTTSTPVILLKKSEPSQSQQSTPTAPSSSKSTATANSKKPASASTPSEGATQAFIKHANPSQGVTETLLREAMERFGVVSVVEIDKRKGFAYVDFADPDGLKKAMAANPVAVAQGTVQVMQRRGVAAPPEKKSQAQVSHTPTRGGRGGRGGTAGRRGGRGGRGGAQASSADAVKAPAVPPTGPATK